MPPSTGSESEATDPTVILGLSSGFHDSAAAIVVDGEIVAAVEEERLTRVKHDAAFPERAADCCLAIASIEPSRVDVVAYHEKPIGVVDRLLRARVSSGPRGVGALLSTAPRAVATHLGVGRQVSRWFRHRGSPTPPLVYAEHHTSHAAAAFYPSPFDSAAVVTIDGVGEWATATIGEGRGRRLRLEREMRYPHSVGLLYSAFTGYCGFRVNGGEGELMGLAPFGQPGYADMIRDQIVEMRSDGSIRLDQRYFRYSAGRRTTSPAFHRLFGADPRPLGSEPTQREADLAASVQAVTEEIVLAMARTAHELTGSRNLCLSGGVALNCVANGRIAEEGPFDQVWVQPAPSDAGNAVGAALWTWHHVLEKPRVPVSPDAMKGAFLGPSFDDAEIQQWLTGRGIDFTVLTPEARDRAVAQRLSDGAIVGWFQGAMEFGPRALGHRSILADPRSVEAQPEVNARVKERAGFRPFGPAVLASHASDWFSDGEPAPYMTFTRSVHDDHMTNPDDPSRSIGRRVSIPRSTIPAVTHVDGSARLQTVDPDHNSDFAGLLAAFERETGCPVVLNTSFNARDEPIVCTPADAYRTFLRTGLDLLVMGTAVIEAT